MTPDTQSFLAWEKASRDTIDVKKIYIDIAESLTAGVLLSQIVYWHLPNKDGSSKLTVIQEKQQWLVKKREEWWDECRITSREADTAISHLVKKGILIKKIYKFGVGNPTTHLRINWPVLIELIDKKLNPQKYSKKDFEVTPNVNSKSHLAEVPQIYNKETTLEQDREQEQSANAGTTQKNAEEKIFISSDLEGSDLKKGTLRIPQAKWDAYVKQYGVARVNRCATELSNYIVKTGTKYKSHYLALNSFIKNSIEKEHIQKSKDEKDKKVDWKNPDGIGTTKFRPKSVDED